MVAHNIVTVLNVTELYICEWLKIANFTFCIFYHNTFFSENTFTNNYVP